MATKADHAEALARALPPGEAWPSDTDGTWELDRLLLALSGEAARSDDDAEAFLSNFLPDTSVDFLPDWERLLSLSRGSLSTAERRAQILAKLKARGVVTRADFESVLQTRRGDPNLRVLQGLHNMFVCGNGVGAPLNSLIGNAAWVVEYMTNRIADPDDFSAWGQDGTAVTADDFGSPVTEDQTADKIAFAANGDFVYYETPAAEGDVLQFAVWLRALDDSAPEVQVLIQDRDNTTADSVTVKLSKCWARVSLRASIGAGGSEPLAIILNNSGGALDIHASYATVGLVDEAFEAYARSLPHVHTIGFFDVIGANG